MTVLKMDDVVHCDSESKPASLFENIPHSQILFLFSPDEIREERENKEVMARKVHVSHSERSYLTRFTKKKTKIKDLTHR